jgi:hypothetical protein
MLQVPAVCTQFQDRGPHPAFRRSLDVAQQFGQHVGQRIALRDPRQHVSLARDLHAQRQAGTAPQHFGAGQLQCNVHRMRSIGTAHSDLLSQRMRQNKDIDENAVAGHDAQSGYSCSGRVGGIEIPHPMHS